MTLIDTFGQLLKYETHRLFHPDASVLVKCTPQEWEVFQAAAKHAAAPVELAAVATAVIERANVTPQIGSQAFSVQFAAGDYHALGEAHEAVSADPEKKDTPT